MLKKLKQKWLIVCPWIKRLIIVAVIGGIVFYFPYITNAVKEMQIKVRHALHFELQQVVVQGHVYTPLSKIHQTVNLTQKSSIWQAHLAQIYQQLMTLPWVQSVVVERRLPDTLVFKITEKKPIAIWQNRQKYFPLDDKGRVIPENMYIKNMLLVVGEGAPQFAPALVETLNKFPDLKKQVVSAVWVRHRRWQLYLKESEGQVIVDLPDNDIVSALEHLRRFQGKVPLANYVGKRLDLRFAGKVIVRATTEEKN